MKKIIMRSFCIAAVLFITSMKGQAQDIKITDGPEFPVSGAGMIRFIDGDDGSFYALRGGLRRPLFYVEKFDKKTMKSLFSIEIPYLPPPTAIADFFYASGNLYIFSSRIDKVSNTISLNCFQVSSDGILQAQEKEFASITSLNPESVFFSISMNPARTKFLINACSSAGSSGGIKADFIVINQSTLSQEWTKTGDRLLYSAPELKYTVTLPVSPDPDGRTGLMELFLDDDDQIYFAFNEMTKNENGSESKSNLQFGNIPFIAASGRPLPGSPRIQTLEFEEDYLVSDIHFSKTREGEFMICGFAKDRKLRVGRDYYMTGIFNFVIDKTLRVKNQSFKMMDYEMAAILESDSLNGPHLRYKTDYVFSGGDHFYMVGEQYRVQQKNTSPDGNSQQWTYQYKDILIAKQNLNEGTEWVRSIPVRNSLDLAYPHVFMVYLAVASEKYIRVFTNDAEDIESYSREEYNRAGMKNNTKPAGKVFKEVKVDLSTGKVSYNTIRKNETFSFSAFTGLEPGLAPPQKSEVFIPGAAGEFYIFTEDKTMGRFTRLKLPE